MTKRRWLCMILAGLGVASPAVSSPLRVACVGDSITAGSGLSNPQRDSYPAILEKLGQGKFRVGNFGVSGSTALSSPFRAWMRTEASREALGFRPNIVVIMLGINDLAFPHLHNRYPEDVQEIVERFMALPSQPTVYLCTLTPIAPEERQVEANRLIRQTLNPAIRAVAEQTGARLIDIHGAFPNRLDLLPDGLHPNAPGAVRIAREVFRAIAPEPAPPALHISPRPGPVAISIRHEALAAEHRARHWLQDHPAPTNLEAARSRLDGRIPETPDDLADWLPLLTAPPPDDLEAPYMTYAALAHALQDIRHETVYVQGTAVEWRVALLHQLVQRQRIAPDGGGYWGGDDPVAAARSTAYALEAIGIALQ